MRTIRPSAPVAMNTPVRAPGATPHVSESSVSATHRAERDPHRRTTPACGWVTATYRPEVSNDTDPAYWRILRSTSPGAYIGTSPEFRSSATRGTRSRRDPSCCIATTMWESRSTSRCRIDSRRCLSPNEAEPTSRPSVVSGTASDETMMSRFSFARPVSGWVRTPPLATASLPPPPNTRISWGPTP